MKSQNNSTNISLSYSPQ